MILKTFQMDVPIHAVETASGRFVNVYDPDPSTINVDDIFWSLSRQSRFAGHTLSDIPWSVGQHSLFVEDLLNLVLSSDAPVELRTSLRTYLSPALLSEFENENFSRSRVLLAGLMHDAQEAYLTDLPSPVKMIEELGRSYVQLEHGLARAIRAALNLPDPNALETAIIKWGDLFALRIEAANLLPSRGLSWNMSAPIFNALDLQLMPTPTPWKSTMRELHERFNAHKSARGREIQALGDE